MSEAESLIARLNLKPLPAEGGFFARTWESATKGVDGRPAATSIFFLVTPACFSAFHRLDAEEIWYFHEGDGLEHWQIDGQGRPVCTLLGGDLLSGQQPHVVVAAGSWQGARIAPQQTHPRGWSLVSCVVCPGWDDRGFTLGVRDSLAKSFPEAASIISALTRS
jgi:predicted cupin superfamily sugar epimerase